MKRLLPAQAVMIVLLLLGAVLLNLRGCAEQAPDITPTHNGESVK